MQSKINNDAIRHARPCRENWSGRFVFIDSVATSIEEIRNPVDSRAYRKPQEEGIHCGNYRARQLTRTDCENFDITFKDVTEGCKALLNKISEK